MTGKFFLVDGHSHLFRAFYALRGLAAPDGRPTNAVFGFTAMIRKLLDTRAPEFLAVAFDMPGPTFRHEMFPDYKATRDHPPDELRVQIPMAREVLDAMRIPVFARQGYEGDDVLGTLARQADEQGLDVYLVTSDKDAQQLLTPRVQMFDTKKDEVLTEKALRERDGIASGQVVDVMALSGDVTDNVPGVPKVGPKTALKLIREHGTLEEVLARALDMKASKLRENLIAFADQARLSKRLVTIDTHVPIEFDLEQCRVQPHDLARMRPVYERFGFRQYLAGTDVEPTRDDADYRQVDTSAAFDGFMKKLSAQKRFSLDLETTSAMPMEAHIVGLSFSWQAKQAWYLPVRAPLGEKTLDEKVVLAALTPILTDEGIEKIGQNLKYDAVVLRNHGVELRGIVFDTMIAAYVLDAERRRYGLAALAADMLDYRMIPIGDLIGSGKKQITMDRVPVETVCEYACADADIAWRLAERLEKQLRDQDMFELFSSIEMPLIPVLIEMEYNGIKLDGDVLKEMSGWLTGQIAELEKEIHKIAGEEFNVASPKQLSKILFEKLGLPVIRRTKTGPSTNSDVLKQLAVGHKLPGLVLEFRQFSKLKSTYVDALPQMVNPATGNIHTSFNQTATATGRLSSSDPNLQNIPIRTELGERIRKAFVPSRPEYGLLTADYSQIELRILAHICADETLRRAFEEDQDIHRFVAAQINGVAPEEVTSAMRRAAKAVNFGIIYGLTPYGLSRDLRIPVGEAAGFIDEYFGRYPGVKRFIHETLEQAREAGYVSTLCGRRRSLPALNDSNRAVRSFAERAAVNTVIQGTAADMIKIAMARIHVRLREENVRARMLLQIHDELVFELPSEEHEQITAVVVEEMTGALELDVPIKVNVATGQNWQEAK